MSCGSPLRSRDDAGRRLHRFWRKACDTPLRPGASPQPHTPKRVCKGCMVISETPKRLCKGCMGVSHTVKGLCKGCMVVSHTVKGLCRCCMVVSHTVKRVCRCCMVPPHTVKGLCRCCMVVSHTVKRPRRCCMVILHTVPAPRRCCIVILHTVPAPRRCCTLFSHTATVCSKRGGNRMFTGPLSGDHSGQASNSSLTVRPSVGWTIVGAISASGSRTKRRRCISGWGRVRRGVWRQVSA